MSVSAQSAEWRQPCKTPYRSVSRGRCAALGSRFLANLRRPDPSSGRRSVPAYPTLEPAPETTQRQPPYTSPTVRRPQRWTARPGKAMATDEGRVPFGERLRRFRVAAGLSQEALAERSGLSAQAIGALETGKRRRPYPHTVAALADALGLTAIERAALTEARGVTTSPPTRAQPPLPRQRAPLVGRDEDVRAIVARLRA